MLLGFHKYSLYRPHKLSWTLSQILLIYYPTWVFTKIPIILLPKLGHKIVLSPQKSPNTFTLWEKSKKAQQNSLIKPVATRHLLKARYYTAPLNPVATRHLLKSCCYMTPLKARCYMAIFLQKFTKPKYYFGNILQNLNTNLTTIL